VARIGVDAERETRSREHNRTWGLMKNYGQGIEEAMSFSEFLIFLLAKVGNVR
jgi:hypothetical protein